MHQAFYNMETISLDDTRSLRNLYFVRKADHQSGWIDITEKLLPNQVNGFYVVIRNSIYEGTGVRLELRMGSDKYDRMVRRNDWTGEGPAFGIGISIPVDGVGVPHLNGDNIQIMGPLGSPHC